MFTILQVAGIIPALMAAESVIFSSFSWRLQEEFMLSLASLPKCFNSETVYNKMMPVIYYKLQKAVSLLKHNLRTHLFIYS